MERVDFITAAMDVIQAMVMGIWALIIMIILLQRKGKWALLVMPMMLYSFLVASWHHVRFQLFITDLIGELPIFRYVYFGGLRFTFTTVLFVAFIPCVMKDKEPKQIEP